MTWHVLATAAPAAAASLVPRVAAFEFSYVVSSLHLLNLNSFLAGGPSVSLASDVVFTGDEPE